MNFKAIHDKYKDDASPSVEGQIRWLQKQGFSQDQIDRAMLGLYSDIEIGQAPRVFEKEENGKIVDTKYAFYSDPIPTFCYTFRDIKTGWELDQSLLEYARRERTKDLDAVIKRYEDFTKTLRNNWVKQVPWYKRIIGKRPEE